MNALDPRFRARLTNEDLTDDREKSAGRLEKVIVGLIIVGSWLNFLRIYF